MYNELKHINDLCNELLHPADGVAIPIGLHNPFCVDLIANAKRSVALRGQNLSYARSNTVGFTADDFARAELEADQPVRDLEKFVADFKKLCFDDRMKVGVPQPKPRPGPGEVQHREHLRLEQERADAIAAIEEIEAAGGYVVPVNDPLAQHIDRTEVAMVAKLDVYTLSDTTRATLKNLGHVVAREARRRGGLVAA